MSEGEFGIQEKPSTIPGKTLNEPLERVLIQRRSEFYAEWILSHPILWGWILLATFNTAADLVVFSFFLPYSFYFPQVVGFHTDLHPLLRTVAVAIWWASLAWSKRLNWKQWIEFAVALMVMWAGVWFARSLVVRVSYMNSGPSSRPQNYYFEFLWMLPPLLGALPGLCWVVLVLRKKRTI